MDKAEHILEKHINENDLNFIFHEKKELWQELLNAVNEALGLAHVMESVCDHEWLNHSFDHFGFLQEQICDKCGAKQSVA